MNSMQTILREVVMVGQHQQEISLISMFGKDEVMVLDILQLKLRTIFGSSVIRRFT